MNPVPVIFRAALLALCAAASFPAPVAGLELQPAAPASGLDVRARTGSVVPRFDGQAETIIVHGIRAPMQADPHATPLRFRDVPQDLQAIDLWALHPGSPPCCQSPYETDIGGQPGLP